MGFYTFAWLCTVSCIHLALAVGVADRDVYYTALRGVRLPGVTGGTAVAGVRSALHCCHTCSKSEPCVVVNYNTASKECELLEQDATLSPLDVSPDWTLYQEVQGMDPMLGAEAMQSSTDYAANASLAIDGIKASDWYVHPCTYTDASDPVHPWWQLELSAFRRINGVLLWNRIDSDRYLRLTDLTIYISQTLEGLGDPSSVCGTFPGPPTAADNPIPVLCQQTMTGRYIKILKSLQAILTFCEVEIMFA